MKSWIVAAPASGSGKTSVTLGLARAARLRGLRVQCFKVGPDFLDPTYLTCASGKDALNLDSWMSGSEYVIQRYTKTCSENDLVLIEGVMGLFDGANPESLDGSTAALAQLLNIPVLLVVPAQGMALSIAALVQGMHTFAPGVGVGGVIANFVGSAKHGELLQAALSAYGQPPLLGALVKGALPPLPSRHLGLHSADEVADLDTHLDALAQVLENSLDLSALFANEQQQKNQADFGSFGTSASKLTAEGGIAPVTTENAKWNSSPQGVRIGVASDAAFRFVYPDNLQALRSAGAELVFFSPLQDSALPENLQGIYLPGGYPELHAAELAANAPMLTAMREAIGAGLAVYAECGGLLYMSQGIENLDGSFHRFLGILPVRARMLAKRKALGYCEVTTRTDTCLGPAGTVLRGHEFHYSELVDNVPDNWLRAYQTKHRTASGEEGYTQGRILASYVHLHFAARPDVAQHFVDFFQGETP